MYVLLILLKIVVVIICLYLIIGCTQSVINRVRVYSNKSGSNNTLLEDVLYLLIDLGLVCMCVFIIFMIFGTIPVNFI